MRTISIGHIALAAMGFGHTASPVVEHTPSSATRRRVYRKPKGDFSPQVNRWTGKPHEHKREIARRLRQAGRAEA